VVTNLNAMGIENVAVVCGDGVVCNSEKLYDRIILTAAVSDIAPAWREAAAPEGTFIVALVAGGGTKCLAFEARENYLQSVWIAGRHRQPRFPRRRPSHHCYVTVREVQQRLSFWLAVHEPYLWFTGRRGSFG